MPRSDTPADENGSSRVYRSSQVHRRRISGEERAALKTAAREAEQTVEQQLRDQAVTRTGGRTRFTDMDVAAPTDVEDEDTADAGVIDAGDTAEPVAIAAADDPNPAAATDDAPAAAAENDGAAPDAGSSDRQPDNREKPRFAVVRGAHARPGQELEWQDVSENPEQDGGVVESSGTPKRRPAVARKSFLPKSRGGRIALYITAGLLAVVLVLLGIFSWNRWWRFDDASDIQGTWYADGTSIEVQIDEESIHFTTDVAYKYEIDSGAKTIEYKFGPMAGKGRYWFTDDRTRLVIEDGDGYTGLGTFFEDLGRALMDLARLSNSKEIELPSGDGVIVLNRTATMAVPTAVPAGQMASSVAAPSAEGESGAAASAPSPNATSTSADAADASASSASPSASASSATGEFADANDVPAIDEGGDEEEAPEDAWFDEGGYEGEVLEDGWVDEGDGYEEEEPGDYA